MKAVQIIGDQVVARAMTDTMRRTILMMLRDRPMTQTQLAEELGLSKAALNHHLKILKQHNLVSIVKKEVESHGIVQKFFAANSYLQLYDFNSLPRDVVSYFYAARLERERGIISMLALNNQSLMRDQKLTSFITKNLSAYLIEAAGPYVNTEIDYGDEGIIYEIYTKAVKALLKEKLIEF
ncbi:transcriptional regulator, ArsR family [Candidatus Nitrososphaera evergladensis SR1]|jgi:DNA-binding transcriptional ArsR family regulator|uniref:Transcriptional regulator, ArsR family n=1 Tax=Candidatus Nitrososphaera evergladensis SR1 TaxID=1459636 RepID=A0A075MPR3_9ARCH|nr:ArsR family transcriptional regulator [Candidatus Nitrososphaera evergladensis]AIF83193.1 transcriptional regulator, ArsR family [Candidatus Nitrososphaera evergladensis SR1]